MFQSFNVIFDVLTHLELQLMRLLVGRLVRVVFNVGAIFGWEEADDIGTRFGEFDQIDLFGDDVAADCADNRVDVWVGL